MDLRDDSGLIPKDFGRLKLAIQVEKTGKSCGEVLQTKIRQILEQFADEFIKNEEVTEEDEPGTLEHLSTTLKSVMIPFQSWKTPKSHRLTEELLDWKKLDVVHKVRLSLAREGSEVEVFFNGNEGMRRNFDDEEADEKVFEFRVSTLTTDYLTITMADNPEPCHEKKKQTKASKRLRFSRKRKGKKIRPMPLERAHIVLPWVMAVASPSVTQLLSRNKVSLFFYFWGPLFDAANFFLLHKKGHEDRKIH